MKTCTVQTVLNAVFKFAPKKFAEDWDNVGLLVGDCEAEVKKFFVCLDVLDENISQAVELGAELIVSHHPMIFRKMSDVRLDKPLGRHIARLIKNDISVIAAHTNLDKASGGVNDVLANRLGLVDVKVPDDEEFSFVRLGKLPTPMTAADFARHVKKSLNAENVRLVDAGDFMIERVGLVGGAGADYILNAQFHGAQAFVTGDVKYHDAQVAVENRIHVVDAGHFATEFPIVHALAEYLRDELKKFPVEVVEDTRSKDFFTTVEFVS